MSDAVQCPICGNDVNGLDSHVMSFQCPICPYDFNGLDSNAMTEHLCDCIYRSLILWEDGLNDIHFACHLCGSRTSGCATYARDWDLRINARFEAFIVEYIKRIFFQFWYDVGRGDGFKDGCAHENANWNPRNNTDFNAEAYDKGYNDGFKDGCENAATDNDDTTED